MFGYQRSLLITNNQRKLLKLLSLRKYRLEKKKVVQFLIETPVGLSLLKYRIKVEKVNQSLILYSIRQQKTKR